MTDEDFEEADEELWATIKNQMKDPQVIAAVALAMVAYQRAGEINSLMGKMYNFMRRKAGLDDADVGLDSFWYIIGDFVGGVSGFAAAAMYDRLKTESEIGRLRMIYNDAMARYRAALEVVKVPEPEPPPPLLSIEEWYGGSIPDTYGPDLEREEIKARYAEYVRSYEIAEDRYRRTYIRWINAHNIVDEGEPQPDPALSLYDERYRMNQLTRVEIALIVFAIVLKPELFTGTIMGLGEWVIGLGEIIPL